MFSTLILLSVTSHALANLSQSRLYHAKYLEQEYGERTLLFEGYVAGNEDLLRQEVEEIRFPQAIIEHEPVSKRIIVELVGKSRASVRARLAAHHVASSNEDFSINPADEVVTLVSGGPAANRIDLVFMGDGYTQAERGKFFADAGRLTDDMFEGKTFSSYLPVFNVHAVFRASKESGIGKNSTPKNTAYGLYRVGKTLRAIFAGNPGAARQSCQAAPGCDFPIIMGNDSYYGGLGGEFAITTSSETSGTMVLRHELGHNFGRVGEEYDGGGYYGVNHAGSLTSLGWTHWLSGEAVVETAVARFIDWPWHHLAGGSFSIDFQSDGRFSASEIQFSASGVETDDTLEILLDGENVPYKSPGHADRAFHEINYPAGFESGTHSVTFTEKIHDENNWLSDLTIFEYGNDYHFAPDYVGAYPLFQSAGVLDGYRPTHETCLMRNMKSDRFCPICKENNWLNFFSRVSLIDRVDVNKTVDNVRVTLQVPQLGQFRNGFVAGEKLEIRWSKNGTEVSSLNDQLTWTRPLSQASGNWEVVVKFSTPEVKKDLHNLLQAKRAVQI